MKYLGIKTVENKRKDRKKYSLSILNININENLKRVKKNNNQQLCIVKIGLYDKMPIFDNLINIFPLYRYRNRDDGICLPELSSKKIGPISHRQPGISFAKDLEIFYQSSKIFPGETIEDHLYVQESNHREFEKSIYKFGTTKPQHENYLRTLSYGRISLYHRIIDLDKTEIHLTRIEMRYIYCMLYENYVTRSNQYNILRKIFNDGYSLNICGFHSSLIKFRRDEEIEIRKEITRIFLNPKESFKQEIILLCLLLNFHPWKEVPEKISEIYNRIII